MWEICKGFAKGFAAGLPILAVIIWFLPTSSMERRSFMAECATARGADDAGLRACAADWPRYRLAKANGWEAR